MNSIRKWFYRPRRDDTSLMAQFYYADEELNVVAGELDSFDGRKDPERCTALVNQLRQAQDKVLNICVEMMEDLLPEERASRDFRVKFPDDVMQETLSGQLWFGAECLAAGSSILNRETESTKMRPLAKAVTKTIENVRNLIREQCLKPIPEYTEKIRESLKIFDRLFADFELSYVSAMVPVKSVEEYEMQQNVAVLFSDTLQRSVKISLVSQEQIDNYDPALMFTIPRLAIVAGLVIFPDGPLNVEKDSKTMSELFRPFKTLLLKIRELLWTMSPQELATLEKCLCSMEEPDISLQTLQKESTMPSSTYEGPIAYTSDFVHRFYANYPSCRQLTPDMISFCASGKKFERNERKRDRNSSKSSRTRARQERQSERFLSRLTGVDERPRVKKRLRRGSSQLLGHSHHQANMLETCQPQVSCQSDAGGTHLNSMIQRPTSNHPSVSPEREMHHSPYRSSGEHHSSSSSRYQSCHSRHRADRINTIVCACGTWAPQVSSNSRPIEVTSPSNEEQLYSVADSSNSSHCPVFCTPTNMEVGIENSESTTYQYLHNLGPQGDTSTVCVESATNSELNRPTNIQNCVTNAVISDPCILFPVSFQESSIPNTNLPLQSETDYVSSDFNNLSLMEERFAPANKNCDDCNNIKSCDTSPTYPTRVDQMMDIACDVGENSVANMCILDSKSVGREVEGLNVCDISSQPSLPVTEPPHTALEPYCTKVSICLHPKEESEHISVNDQEADKSYLVNYDTESHTEDADVGSSGSTSPHHSGTEDDEEVALALQAAEVAASWKARERFANSSDLIQRLFVCISGVADQLQTNYASDLRKILCCVFTMNQTPDEEEFEILQGKENLLSRKESSNEDGSSTNGSEQLSVESAEDALTVIGSPETGQRSTVLGSPSDAEEDDDRDGLHTDPSRPRSLLRANSVLVPASVFNDHSLMQYSAMSPPPPINEHDYGRPIEGGEMFDNEDPSYCDLPSNRHHPEESEPQNVLFFNLNSISESVDSLPNVTPISTLIPVATPPLIPLSGSDMPSPNSHSSTDVPENQSRRFSIIQEPPLWIPDHLAPRCMACGALFTIVRRRHHCRNCGKVFCGHCSRHSVPLPHFGIWKNVRVCNACFLYYVTSSADGSSALS